MSNKAMETLAWVLIYSGMLLASLGYFLWREHALLGGALLVGGLADAVIGLVLIWVRSRRPR